MNSMRVVIPSTGYFGQIRHDIKEAVLVWLDANVGKQISIEDSKDDAAFSLSTGHKVVHIGHGWRYHKEWVWIDVGDGLKDQLLDIEEVNFDTASSAIMFKLAAPWDDAIKRWEI